MTYPSGAVSKWFVVLAACLTCVAGCGGSDRMTRAQVTGKVLLDNKPVAAGTILFRPDKGRAGRGKIVDGEIVSAATYELDDGIVLGNHQIAIQPLAPVAPVMFDRMEDPTQPNNRQRPSAKPDVPKPIIVNIPRKYRDPSTSGITAEITDGDNELTIELTSK